MKTHSSTLASLPFAVLSAAAPSPLPAAPGTLGSMSVTPGSVEDLEAAIAYSSVSPLPASSPLFRPPPAARQPRGDIIRHLDFYAPLIPPSPAEDSLIVPPRNLYIAPNEFYPLLAQPIFTHSNMGIHIAVGTERGFMGAIASHASHLVLIDCDPNVLMFNRFNIALLRASENRRHYLTMRTAPTAERLMAELSAGRGDERLRAFIGAHAQWWIDKVLGGAHGRGVGGFAYLNENRLPAFAGCNYLYDDDLFRIIHRLALKNRIQAYGLDLSNEAAVLDFFVKVQRLSDAEGFDVGAVDLSNCWYDVYLGHAGIKRVISLMHQAGAAGPTTLLVLSTMGPEFGMWRYFGLHMSFLDDSPELLELDEKHGFIEVSLAAIDEKFLSFKRIVEDLAAAGISNPRLRYEPYALNGMAGAVALSEMDVGDFERALAHHAKRDDLKAVQRLIDFGIESRIVQRMERSLESVLRGTSLPMRALISGRLKGLLTPW